MKIKNNEIDLNEIFKSIICFAAGTGLGLIVYALFLFFKIDIFGWNLGLIFAPVIAGYIETVLANKLLGHNLGAISAFILFIYTTFYSFILKNPTLGMNIITAGSIVVILQAAFPTLINYILLVVIGAIMSNLKWVFKQIWQKIRNNVRWETTDEITVLPSFNEEESNKTLNSLDFFFITSNDMKNRPHDLLGIFQSEVFIEREKEISVKREDVEKKQIYNIKKGKDECLIKLAKTIKENGGNGILDLNIEYGNIGLNGDNIHIVATGIGINIY